MENKKNIKINLGTAICISIIVALIIIGCTIILIQNEKLKEARKVLNADPTQKTQSYIDLEPTYNQTNNGLSSTNTIENTAKTTEAEFKAPSLATSKAKIAENNASYNFNYEGDVFSGRIENGEPYLTCKKEKNWIVDTAIAKENEIKMEQYKECKISGFSKKVVEIYEGFFGQQDVERYILFLMEDGTVEYSTISNLVKNLSTQGQVKNASNIVKLQNVSVGYMVENGEIEGGISSVIAIDKDNNFYDLRLCVPTN